MKIAGVAASVLALMSSVAFAQNKTNIESDRVAVYLGALYLWDTEMDISVAGPNTPFGATINFERDLNLDQSVTAPRVGGYVRFNPHHRLDFNWYKIDQDSSRSIGRELSFDDQVYFVGAEVSTSLKTEVAMLPIPGPSITPTRLNSQLRLAPLPCAMRSSCWSVRRLSLPRNRLLLPCRCSDC